MRASLYMSFAVGTLWTVVTVYWWMRGVAFQHHLRATGHLIQYHFGPKYSTSSERQLPSCCLFEDCLLPTRQQHNTVLTLLTTDTYLPLLQVRAEQDIAPWHRPSLLNESVPSCKAEGPCIVLRANMAGRRVQTAKYHVCILNKDSVPYRS